MKKVALLIVCALLACNIYAQERKATWGVKAGLNISGFWKGVNLDPKYKLGYQLGVVYEYRFTHLFALAPELVFSSEGMKGYFYDDDLDAKVKSTVFANYINLPVMAKFYVLKGLSVDFGPQIGVNVFMHKSVDGYGVKMDSDDYHGYHFGFGLGATYSYKDIFIQARYNLGLTNVFTFTSSKDYNFQIALGYKF